MGLLRTQNEDLLETAAALGESADENPISRWVKGVIFPVVPLLVSGFFALRALMRWMELDVVNSPARRELIFLAGFSLLFFNVAMFMHAHFFWTPHPRWHIVG